MNASVATMSERTLIRTAIGFWFVFLIFAAAAHLRRLRRSGVDQAAILEVAINGR